MRDIIKKIPKRRGYGKNRGRTYVPHPEAVAISIEKLANLFESGAEVSMKSFIERGIVSGRKQQQVKIVGGGELSKKFSLKGIATTASARAAIEKAGGVILDVISEADAQAARTKTNKTTRAAEKAAAKKE
jgi:large subunit ribosomal protein L15